MALTDHPVAASSGGSSLDAAWFASTLTVMQSKVATLTDIIIRSDMGTAKPLLDVAAIGTGTIVGEASAFSFQTGAGANNTATGFNTTSENFILNVRTNKYAVAVRLTKIANTATCDNRMCGIALAGDIITIGIQGATSQTLYTIRTVANGITSTAITQSAAGTYDTLILICDGANINAYIGLGSATPTATVTQSQATMGAVGGHLEFQAANGGTAANSGFKVDKYIVVQEPAS